MGEEIVEIQPLDLSEEKLKEYVKTEYTPQMTGQAVLLGRVIGTSPENWKLFDLYPIITADGPVFKAQNRNTNAWVNIISLFHQTALITPDTDSPLLYTPRDREQTTITPDNIILALDYLFARKTFAEPANVFDVSSSYSASVPTLLTEQMLNFLAFGLTFGIFVSNNANAVFYVKTADYIPEGGFVGSGDKKQVKYRIKLATIENFDNLLATNKSQKFGLKLLKWKAS